MTDQRKLRLLHLVEQAEQIPGTHCSINFEGSGDIVVYFFQFKNHVSKIFDYSKIFLPIHPEYKTNRVFDTSEMEKAEAYILQKLKEGGIEIA